MCILIVDDSKAMRLIVRKALRHAGYEGYSIEEASNGKEALERIQKADLDLILCDWNMPDMGGYELLSSLSDRDRQVPFGFVTSETTPEVRERALAAGARFLIGKPFDADTFKGILGPILPAR